MSPITFDQEQVQKLTEIGAHLRKLRTQKGLSLEDVATKTLIQHRLLKAIEQGQPDQLPEALYVRGFIRRFAEALDVDGAQLAETFPLGQNQLASSNSLLNSSPTLRPWHLYILYIGLVIAAAVGLSYVLSQQNLGKKSSSPPATVPTAKVSPAPASSAPKAVVAPKPKAPAAPVQAKLTLKADSYVEITTDNQSIYTGILKVGTTKIVTAKQNILVRTGNAGGVVLSVNNRVGKVMGKMGDVQEVTLTPNSQ